MTGSAWKPLKTILLVEVSRPPSDNAVSRDLAAGTSIEILRNLFCICG